MDKDEIITLSSDEEGDSVIKDKPKLRNAFSNIILQSRDTEVQTNKVKSDALKGKVGLGNKQVKGVKKLMDSRNIRLIKGSNCIYSIKNSHEAHNKSPEVVDLVETIDKSSEEVKNCLNENINNETVVTVKNLPDSQDIEILKSDTSTKEKLKNKLPVEEKDKNVRTAKQTCKPQKDTTNVNENCNIVENSVHNHLETRINGATKSKAEVHNNSPKDVSENSSVELPEFYKEFVDSCASFENNLYDRMRMIVKLRKRYTEADNTYVTSREFQSLIEISKSNLNLSNFYAVAKAVTDQLKWWQKVEESVGKQSNESNQSFENGTIQCNRHSEKQIRLINKIIKKLDKLGKRIREVEEAEVDWSDEEGSSYVQLQRYRERYCQIYQKLCKYTNEVSDVNRVYCRKISFTGSKYQSINKCIEKWLNKTKRFPDFSDIMKLLESQSSSLGFPNNRESIRILATEIFQQVGQMLQLRRKYDLWDSYCGFLDNSEDPAKNDSSLEKTLKENFENRLKKEQEIINYYAELQEKERLEPEEVPEEEANNSPAESGNEEEEEIEEVEKTIHKRLDTAIELEQVLDNVKENDNHSGNQDCNNVSSEEDYAGLDKENNLVQVKESKNNFKNCKSLKWRGDKSLKSKKETNSEISNFENEEDRVEDNDLDYFEEDEIREIVKDDSDLELIGSETPASIEKEKCVNKAQISLKRVLKVSEPLPKKKLCLLPQKKEIQKAVIEIDTEKDYKKMEEIIDINYCQIEYNFNAIADKFTNFSEKEDWGKGKVFRDLTNVNRLLEQKGKKRLSLELFSQTFYSYELDKFARKRLSFGYNLVSSKSRKCALNNEEKSVKNISGKNGEKEERSRENNSVSGADTGSNCFSNGSGSEEDNNENDENKKRNAKNGSDSDENKEEEENDEEDDEEEETDKTVAHSAGDNQTRNTFAEIYSDVEGKNIEDRMSPETGKHLKEGSVNESEEFNDSSDEERDPTQKGNIIESDGKVVKECELTMRQCGSSADDVDEEEKNEEKKMKSENEVSNYLEETEVKFEKKANVGKDTVLEEEEVLNKSEEKHEESIEENVTIRKDLEKNKEYAEGKKDVEANEDKKESNNEEYLEKKEEEMNGQEVIRKGEKEPIEKNEAVESGVIARNENEVEGVTEKEEGFTGEFEKESMEKTEDTTNVDKETVESYQEEENKSELTKKETKEENLGAHASADAEEFSSKNFSQSESKSDSFSDGIIEVEVELHEEEDYLNAKGTLIKGRNPFQRFEGTSIFTNSSRNVQNVDSVVRNIRKRNNIPSTSDEERVKQFLLHSPSSISITPPKKLSLSKPPSQAALQALATLRGLKGISTTRVRGKRKPEDEVVVIGESQSRQTIQNFPKRQRNELPIITNVQSVKNQPTPKIVTVQGNAPGFGNPRYGRINNGQQSCNSLRISNVWGGLSNTFYQTMQDNPPVLPSCSSRQARPPSNPPSRKKSTKKTVEYVVLE